MMSNLLTITFFLLLRLKIVASDFCKCYPCSPLMQMRSNPFEEQNDALLVPPPPNPKPLLGLTDQTQKFYKIESATTNPTNDYADQTLSKISALLQPKSRGAQALLLPVPVAALILRPIQNYEFSSTTTKPFEECEKCAEEQKSSELEEEAEARGDPLVECQEKHEHRRNEGTGKRASIEEQTNKANLCFDCSKCEEEELNTNDNEEHPCQQEKIPIEVFKKFVAKNTEAGSAPKNQTDPANSAASIGKQQESSEWVALKERLKEISNKMDKLHNISLEIEKSADQRVFPMAKFMANEDGYRKQQSLDSPSSRWQNYRRMKIGNTDAGTFQQGQISSTPENKIVRNGPQPQDSFKNLQRLQYEPTFSRSINNDFMNQNLRREILPQKPTEKSILGGNSQQFLLNAIEEFLRESQKYRQSSTTKYSEATSESTKSMLNGENTPNITEAPTASPITIGNKPNSMIMSTTHQLTTPIPSNITQLMSQTAAFTIPIITSSTANYSIAASTSSDSTTFPTPAPYHETQWSTTEMINFTANSADLMSNIGITQIQNFDEVSNASIQLEKQPFTVSSPIQNDQSIPIADDEPGEAVDSDQGEAGTTTMNYAETITANDSPQNRLINLISNLHEPNMESDEENHKFLSTHRRHIKEVRTAEMEMNGSNKGMIIQYMEVCPFLFFVICVFSFLFYC